MARNANLGMAEGLGFADSMVLLLHGAGAHCATEIIRESQQVLLDNGRSSLTINPGLGHDNRHGRYDCTWPRLKRQVEGSTRHSPTRKPGSIVISVQPGSLDSVDQRLYCSPAHYTGSAAGLRCFRAVARGPRRRFPKLAGSICMAYIKAVMKLLIFIVLGMLVCWEATDVVADDILSAVLAPIGLVFFFFWGIGWLLVKAFRRGGAGGGSAAASLGDFGDFGGGD